MGSLVSQQPEAILALGKKIVDELGLSDGVDTLGRWMAHYVAELIQQAEQANGQEQQTAAKKACFDTILKLWDHRATALHEVRPGASLASAIAVLKAANGQDEDNLYWRHNTRNTAHPWAKFIQGLRQAVDRIVLYCVSGSVNEEILIKEKNWAEQHGEFLSDDELEMAENIDALLQGGQPIADQVVLVYGKTRALSTEERQSMILTQIEELLNDQLANLKQLQTNLDRSDGSIADTDRSPTPTE